eukprot:UN13839
MKRISFHRFFLCRNIFEINFFPKAELAKLFERIKHKCLHIFCSDGTNGRV